MDNVFGKSRDHGTFSWDSLGDIKEGRGDLGDEMPVLVYRLMQYTLLDVLTKELGRKNANDLIRAAGQLAGTEFARHVLRLSAPFDEFIADLQRALHEYKIGILRLEEFCSRSGEIMLTVGQDLDCSGIPVSNENVCDYDEGFLAGILEAYTGKAYAVKEIDCWASGNRVCRFRGSLKD